MVWDISPSLLQEYYSLRNTISSTIKRNKCVFIHSLSSSRPKKFWSFVHSARKRPSVPTHLSKGIMFSSSSYKAEILNKFFSKCFNSWSPPTVAYLLHSRADYNPVLLTLSEQNLRFLGWYIIFRLPQPLVQIRSHLKCLNMHVYPLLLPSLTFSTCPCPKGMYQLTRKLPLLLPSLSFHLTWISNLDNPSNYRPISLLSIVSKLLEKYIYSHLYKFCLEHNLISTTQFGYLSHRSTSSALLFASHSFHSLLQTNKLVCLFSRSQDGLRLHSS